MTNANSTARRDGGSCCRCGSIAASPMEEQAQSEREWL